MRRVRSPVVVGRAAELAAIWEGLAGAAARRGGCMLLLGEAGAGKSRLLREAGAAAERSGMPCLTGGPPKLVRPPAYGVLAQVLRSWTRASRTPDRAPDGTPDGPLAPFAAGLRQVLPEWPAPSAPAAADLSHDQLRLLVLEGAFRLLVQAAGGHGAVVLLDDLQDADPETLEFVHHAAAAAQAEPVFVVGAARIPEGRPVAAEAHTLEARGVAAVFELAPLGEAEVAAVIEAVLGVAAPSALVAEIAARTDGVPLFVEELLEAQLATGALRVEGGAVRWGGSRGWSGAVAGRTRPAVGATTVELVAEKLRRIGQQARGVLAASALLGRFDPEVLAAVTDTDPLSVSASLRAGVAVGLLEAMPSEVSFRHALVRDAMVGLLLPAERIQLHRRVAEAIAQVHGDDPAWLEERAHHLEAFGEADQAAALLVQAGHRSLGAHAPASAEATLRRALTLAQSEATRHRARDALAETLGMLGRWEESLHLDAELLRRLGTEGATALRLERMAENAVRAGQLDTAERLIARARQARADPARLAGLAALVLLWRGRLAEAIQAAEQALALALPRATAEAATTAATAGDARVACQALDVLGRATDALGRRAEAQAHLRRWIEVARTAGLAAQHVQALMELGTLEFLAGGPADRLREAREVASRNGIFVPLVLADLSLLWWLGRRARAGEALAMGQEAAELCRRLSLDLLPHALVAQAWARNLTACDAGDALVVDALGLAPGDVDLRILAGWIRGESALRAGRPTEAVRSLEGATRQMHASPSAVPPPAPFLWVAALLLAGRRAQAAAVMPEVRSSPALPRQYLNPLWLGVDEALLHGSADRFEQAIGPYRGSAPFDVAVAQVVAAEVIGGPQAVGWLRDALSVFGPGGLETDAARARRLLRSLGGPVPRTRRKVAMPELLQGRGVTAREAEVLALVGQGLTNAQIAGRLFLSPRTIQSHISSLLSKLRVSNRAGLIAIALSLGGEEQGLEVRAADTAPEPDGTP